MRRILGALAALCLSLVSISLTAVADEDSAQNLPATASANIVQLGDSYSAGNGTGTYEETNCMRSSRNYGARAAEAVGALYTNVACSGAVTRYITQPRSLGWKGGATRSYWLPTYAYPDQAAEWQKRVEAEGVCGAPPADDMYYEYRMVAPAPAGSIFTASVACYLWAKPQIEAVSPATDAVFLTIGGNDANFVGIIISCFVARNANSCQNRLTTANAIFPQLRQRIDSVLTEIDRASQGHARVYLLGYPVLISEDSYVLPEGPAGWYDAGKTLRGMQEHANELQRGVIEEMNARTESNRFTFVDVQPAFTGHGFDPRMGARQDHSWIVPSFSSFDVLGYVHPTQQGWTAEADLLTDYLLTDGF